MTRKLQTTCCIVGGGPAGIMLGYLLARVGVNVTVLEKHKDFLRDFRGDTIHPSTLQLMHELGLLDELLEEPHQKVHNIKGYIGNSEFTFADFSHLPVKSPYIALMPQWDFLNFLVVHAKKFPLFHLHMEAEVTGLLQQNGVITGVKATTPEGDVEITSSLTIGADGRHSTVREQAGFDVEDIGAPIDVLWMRISRFPTDPDQPLGRFDKGKVFVMIYRDTYWQCAYVIPKGGFEEIRQKDIESFTENIAEMVPFLANRVDEISSWDDVKLLTVTVDRLNSWCRPGLLCIGDAAHAMSPIGGVGINLAIQDAVATANILAAPLRQNNFTLKDLEKIQQRREFPTRMTQKLQVLVQNHIIGKVIISPGKFSPPWLLSLLLSWPFFRRIPARLIGIGFRPEHISRKLFR